MKIKMLLSEFIEDIRESRLIQLCIAVNAISICLFIGAILYGQTQSEKRRAMLEEAIAKAGFVVEMRKARNQ